MPEPDWMLLLSAARLAVGIEYVTSFLRSRAARRGGVRTVRWRAHGASRAPRVIRGGGRACTHPLRPGTAVMVMAVAVLTSCVPALLNVSVVGDLHARTPSMQ